MDRRGVLKGLGVATAAALWPGWLREAFAGPPCGVMRGAETLVAAIQRAHAGLKPLLMLVIPTDRAGKWSRGTHFGEWLNTGSSRDLAALAMAEVVCAEMAAVQQLFPSAPKDAPGPAVLLADVDRSPARVSVALQSFPSHEEDAHKALMAGTLDMAAEEADVLKCIDRTGTAIREALMDDEAALERRAAGLWERLDGGTRGAVKRVLGGGPMPLGTVLQVSPLLVATARREPALATHLTPLLANAARAAYCAQRVPGSKWAVSSGCGASVEGEEPTHVKCGMGYVPLASQRFLYFFTKSPDQLIFDHEQ